MSTFKGKTEDAGAPFVGADWWERGKKLLGKVVGVFRGANGFCFRLKVPGGVQLNGKSYDVVSLGGLKGLDMALQAAGLPGIEGLLPEDRLHVECTGFSETNKGHKRANFEVEIIRPDTSPSEGNNSEV